MPQLGKRLQAPMKQRSGRQRMWLSMRVLREFGVAELVTTAEVEANDAGRYTRRLAQAGYLRKVNAARGCLRAPNRYRLVRNTGPLAPRAGSKGVTDPNTGKQYDATGAELNGEGASDELA